MRASSWIDSSKELKRFQRNRVGGVIRAAHAARFSDGTFMSDADWDELVQARADEDYERHAAGGRARAARARRGPDGRYLK